MHLRFLKACLKYVQYIYYIYMRIYIWLTWLNTGLVGVHYTEGWHVGYQNIFSNILAINHGKHFATLPQSYMKSIEINLRVLFSQLIFFCFVILSYTKQCHYNLATFLLNISLSSINCVNSLYIVWKNLTTPNEKSRNYCKFLL